MILQTSLFVWEKEVEPSGVRTCHQLWRPVFTIPSGTRHSYELFCNPCASQSFHSPILVQAFKQRVHVSAEPLNTGLTTIQAEFPLSRFSHRLVFVQSSHNNTASRTIKHPCQWKYSTIITAPRQPESALRSSREKRKQLMLQSRKLTRNYGLPAACQISSWSAQNQTTEGRRC
jgi:hypothetical protein